MIVDDIFTRAWTPEGNKYLLTEQNDEEQERYVGLPPSPPRNSWKTFDLFEKN